MSDPGVSVGRIPYLEVGSRLRQVLKKVKGDVLASPPHTPLGLFSLRHPFPLGLLRVEVEVEEAAGMVEVEEAAGMVTADTRPRSCHCVTCALWAAICSDVRYMFTQGSSVGSGVDSEARASCTCPWSANSSLSRVLVVSDSNTEAEGKGPDMT